MKYRTTIQKALLYIAIITALLGLTTAGVKLYRALDTPTSSATPTAAPIPQKLTYTITVSREVATKQ